MPIGNRIGRDGVIAVAVDANIDVERRRAETGEIQKGDRPHTVSPRPQTAGGVPEPWGKIEDADRRSSSLMG